MGHVLCQTVILNDQGKVWLRFASNDNYSNVSEVFIRGVSEEDQVDVSSGTLFEQAL